MKDFKDITEEDVRKIMDKNPAYWMAYFENVRPDLISRPPPAATVPPQLMDLDISKPKQLPQPSTSGQKRANVDQPQDGFVKTTPRRRRRKTTRPILPSEDVDFDTPNRYEILSSTDDDDEAGAPTPTTAAVDMDDFPPLPITKKAPSIPKPRGAPIPTTDFPPLPPSGKSSTTNPELISGHSEAASAPAAAPPAKPQRIPPIILRTKDNWSSIATELQRRKLVVLKARTIQDGISIQPATIEDYRGITKMFAELSLPYHSYMLQDEKPLKAVLRGLPTTVSPEEILEDLKFQQIQARSVTMMRGRDRRPMPLFLVQLDRTEDGKKIFNVTQICLLQVRVESPRKISETSQCHRCQRFHHAQSRCFAPPRCVKCGEDHHSVTCTKPRDLPAKCANCDGDHPASYRGCPAFPKPPARFNNHTSSRVNPARTFAAASRPAETSQPTIPAPVQQPQQPDTTLTEDENQKFAKVFQQITAAFQENKTKTELLGVVLAAIATLLR